MTTDKQYGSSGRSRSVTSGLAIASNTFANRAETDRAEHSTSGVERFRNNTQFKSSDECSEYDAEPMVLHRMRGIRKETIITVNRVGICENERIKIQDQYYYFAIDRYVYHTSQHR